MLLKIPLGIEMTRDYRRPNATVDDLDFVRELDLLCGWWIDWIDEEVNVNAVPAAEASAGGKDG